MANIVENVIEVAKEEAQQAPLNVSDMVLLSWSELIKCRNNDKSQLFE